MQITHNIPRIKVTPPEPRTEQESLFRSVQTIETAFLDHKAIAHAKGSALLLNLLKVHGTLLTNVKQLKPDDVFVVHRKKFEKPYQLAHGFIAKVFDIMEESYALVIHEVSSNPRNYRSFAKIIPMTSTVYPDMGIYSSNNMYQEDSLRRLIDMGVVYKVNISDDQLEQAIKELGDDLKRPDGAIFYGKTYDCNRFLYDVLRKVYR